MTAFAAVLVPDETLLDSRILAPIGSALERLTATPAHAVRLGRCALLQSPLHSSDLPGPCVHNQTGVAVAGQVVLEDRCGLIERLDLERGASNLAIVATAFDRWGIELTEHLSGEYAFTLWDRHRDLLVCARDGLGIRLLYVGAGNRTVVASNSIGAVLASGLIARDLDPSRLVSFLATGRASTQTRTVYRAVNVVPEGHTLAMSGDDRRTLRRHWWMPGGRGGERQFALGRGPRRADVARRGGGGGAPAPVEETRSHRSGKHEIAEGYRAVLEAAVADRTGGEPASLFLSGGLDSTTIAAAARQVGSPLHAFTVVYRDLCGDELSLAALVADRLHVPLTMLEGDRYQALDAESTRLALEQPLEEPTLADWRSVLGRAARFSTVALYGEDGDAIFLSPGGRELARSQPAGLALSAARYIINRRRRPYVGARIRERFQRLAAFFPSAMTRAAATETGERASERSMTPEVPPWLTPETLRLLQPSEPDLVLGLRPTPLPDHPTRSRTQDRLTRTIPRLAETIGLEVTRQRVELRLPLLDTRILRYIFSIPPIPWSQHKELARVAFRGILPDEILDRPKAPLYGFYEAQVAAWRHRIGAHLPDAPALPREWINRNVWQQALSRGGSADAIAAWRVLHLDAWLAQHQLRLEPMCTA
jgi:asparagine synthase (glutamine-hydrolysing)